MLIQKIGYEVNEPKIHSLLESSAAEGRKNEKAGLILLNMHDRDITEYEDIRWQLKSYL